MGTMLKSIGSWKGWQGRKVAALLGATLLALGIVPNGRTEDRDDSDRHGTMARRLLPGVPIPPWLQEADASRKQRESDQAMLQALANSPRPTVDPTIPTAVELITRQPGQASTKTVRFRYLKPRD